MKDEQDKRDEEKPSQAKFSVVDRRHKSDETSPTQYKKRYPTFVEQLQERLAAKDRLLEEYKEKLKLENEAYKKRLGRDMQNRQENEKVQLFSRLLPVLDNLGRALASAEANHSYDMLLQGLKQIMTQFQTQLQTEGISKIEAVGKVFDPHTQEATAVIAVQKKKQDHLVVEEIEAGYTLGDKLIRPAKVRVGQFKQH